jgi:hypothetical protein
MTNPARKFTSGGVSGGQHRFTRKRYAHLTDDPLRAAAERFGSKMDALENPRPAKIVVIPSLR